MTVVKFMSTGLDCLVAALTKAGVDFPAPAWHGHVLRETEERIASGESKFMPWEEAKEQIRVALA